MTEPKNVNGGVKTLAIRLPDELHAQLVIVAQLDGLSLTDGPWQLCAVTAHTAVPLRVVGCPSARTPAR